MRFLPSGLRVRLLLLVVVPLIPVLGLVIFDALLVRQTSMQHAEEDLRHVAHLAAMVHDGRLEDTRRMLARLSDDPLVRFGSKRACSSVLGPAIEGHPGYPNIGIVNADGTIACSALPTNADTHLPPNDTRLVVERAIATGAFAVGNFTIGPISHRPVILTGYPIASADGSSQQVIVVSLDVAWLGEFATNALLPPDATMAIIDREGRIVARYPHSPSLIGTSVRNNVLYPIIVRAGGDGVATGPGVDGKLRLYAFAKIRGADGATVQFIVVGLPVKTLSTAADRALRSNLALLAIVFAISVAAAWGLGSVTVVRPVRRMLDATRRITRGDLSARAGLDQSGGEMASLAAGFDRMADAMQQRLRTDAEASEALRRERDYVRHIIDATPALVCGILPDGRTTFANPAVESTTGYPARELIGRDWWRTFYPGESYAQVDRLFVDFARGPVRDYEMDLTTAKGETRTVSWNSLNKMNPSGEVVEVIGFGMDITERKRAERERDRFEIQLRQAQKLESIGQLAAGIAHEINTPTQYIGDNMRFLGDSFSTLEQMAQLVQRLTSAESDDAALAILRETRSLVDASTIEYVTQEIPQAIAQSLDGVERVARIVRAMKEFSVPGDDAQGPLDLNRSLENTLTVATNEWKYLADIVMDFAPDLPPVNGYANELNQVFLNLIINAAHAIAEASDQGRLGRGVIELSTRRVDDSVEVRISDTGVGIPRAIRERVFDPFFTTKPVGKGTGQGLAICYSVVVERHRGTIMFDSEVGQGTTFVVTLPLAPDGECIVETAA